MIDVTDCDLRKMIKAAYDLSVPLGLGHLHYTPQPLGDATADEILADFKDDSHVAVSLDYLGGRACKLTVFRKGDRLEMRDDWYDHTPAQLSELLNRARRTSKASAV